MEKYRGVEYNKVVGDIEFSDDINDLKRFYKYIDDDFDRNSELVLKQDEAARKFIDWVLDESSKFLAEVINNRKVGLGRFVIWKILDEESIPKEFKDNIIESRDENDKLCSYFLSVKAKSDDYIYDVSRRKANTRNL